MASAEAAASPPPESPGPERVYFPELDGLRFVAFAMVYLFHRGVPQWNRWVAWLLSPVNALVAPPPDLGRRLAEGGWVGVQLFFILSGFLITTLLLREEDMNGRIDLRAFWIRRILRIWPLYYLTLFLTFIVLPACDGVLTTTDYRRFLAHQGLPFLLFGGNWSMGLLGPAPFDHQTILWSVCVEEQFYLPAPLLIAFVPRRYRILVVVLGIAAGVVSRFLMARAGAGPLLFQYATTTQLDTLLAGVALALGLHGRSPGPRLRRCAALVSCLGGAAWVGLMMQPGLAHGSIERRTCDFVWLWLAGSCLIGGLAVGGGPLRRVLAYPRFVWLGRISYGLYMFHEIALWASGKLFDALGFVLNGEELHTLTSLALTVGLAAASYYGLERPFLRRKTRWTRVASRPV